MISMKFGAGVLDTNCPASVTFVNIVSVTDLLYFKV